ncbi:MAG: carboxypeptidase-like regulatory domain-containing protein, partial [Flavobacteriaceae bacterium]|nr:carboxypeptidase-like regulatory domain-containing protein [Flavobacteriaceae bacterium]
MRKIIITLLGCLFMLPIFSQNKIIGFVKDMASSKPLPFATILINNSISVITDAEGKFEITLTNETKEVKVSYLGFETQKISLTPQSNFYQINLNPKVENLDEVTVYARDNAALRILKKAV